MIDPEKRPCEDCPHPCDSPYNEDGECWREFTFSDLFPETLADSHPPKLEEDSNQI